VLSYKAGGPGLYAIPRQRSVERFMDKVRAITKRRGYRPLRQMVDELNPVVRGWGTYYKRAHVRRLFYRLNSWIIRRVWNFRYRWWRNAGWRKLPHRKLYGELGLVNLLQLIPSMQGYYRQEGYAR